MDTPQQFALPDVGEGLTEAEIVAWHVNVGDTVAINDVLVEIETAKSAVELPSPYAGVVQQLLVSEGVTVPVGTVIIEIASDQPAAQATSEPEPSALRPKTGRTHEVPSIPIQGEDDERPQVLVGPGPKEAAERRRRVSPPTDPARSAAPTTGATPLEHVTAEQVSSRDGTSKSISVTERRIDVRTTPPVRLLAKQLGVELDSVTPAQGEVITRGDVEAAAGKQNGQHGVISAERPADLLETRVPIRGIRKLTADAMCKSAFTAPHVTEWLTVDVTPMMDLIAQVKADRSWDGIRVNPLVLVARAFVLAIRAHPEINATWDDKAQEIVIKHYINLGIAAATPRGLIVPNIKDAHTLDVRGLADALTNLITIARSGRTSPADMSQGTVTITNIGALGVDAGTPILNPGEAAILAFGAIRAQPWVVNGKIEIRQVTQLAMSFDHRLVDGELGSKVLARTAAILADPGTTLLYV
ncbi:dihydrolipoamide acetyltransferase family protein [Rhodococcus ruber]|uniref:Dihydrolipoamide acetyltransferase component of pyruvate dehydrogenase complex n=1 Tax=Rhodococcus ruber TaxID=1830 RepID=A0ABT4ML69_9NOCA|nr:dihydrolipoamide acetyltransferase family protein [Rhodococcus ruber]MCZ4521732.1 dihydrolipoamide acetyltransferase family protein [Rhodococcus ruber]